MFYNLWILKDCFSDIIAEENLSSKTPQIEDFRLYDDTSVKKDSHILYIGEAASLLPDHKEDPRILLCCQDDYLLLDSTDMTDTVNRIFSMHRLYTNLEEQCRQIISRESALSNLLDIGEELLKSPLLIINSSQYLLAGSHGFAEMSDIEGIRQMLENKTMAVKTLEKFNLEFDDTFRARYSFFLPEGLFPTASLCHNIFIQDELTATLILTCHTGTRNASQDFLFEQFVPFVQEWIERNRSEDSENHFNSSFARLLDKNTDSVPIFKRGLALRGWEEDCPMIIIAAAAISTQSHFDRFLSRTTSLKYSGIVGIAFQKNIVLLCNMNMIHEEELQELETLLLTHQYYGATSNSFRNLLQIPDALEQAAKILEAKKPVAGKIYYFQKNAVSWLTSLSEHSTSMPFLHPLVSVLADYDRNYHTEFYKTLFCYLENERNQQLTSRILFIHRNTLSLRLARIQNLWNPDLENPEERFYLLYSFYHNENLH